MNFYIDFDNTLYNTTALADDMLQALAKHISKTNDKDESEILEELKGRFNRNDIYNIFTLCKIFEKQYNIESGELESIIKNILENGNDYIYDDVPEFLQNLRKNNNTLYLLTVASGKDNVIYQTLKIKGSGIAKYFDKIRVTTDSKSTLKKVNYSNGTFIDDNPRELIRLRKVGAKKIIRIKRPNVKYSEIDLDDPSINPEQISTDEIEEYTALSEIKFNEKQTGDTGDAFCR